MGTASGHCRAPFELRSPVSHFRPSVLPPSLRARGVTAVLGPTNTGKTRYAIERMLAHPSGLIGLPLRLLAREVYGHIVNRIGEREVALVTGEEKIKPPNPRYWVATVEAMPRDLDVSFVAIDEIQLAADFERGHVFCDRFLNRRGRDETLVLGAATMRPLVERLIPGVSVVQRPRLSQLVYAGEKKLTRLPQRSAIVAFSAEEVYAIAELIRRQRGGAAVVLGALSPRTRNAQVALYQSGDVDFLVATDAIGMGLNLDVDHVAFASDRKFDGFQYRRLSPAELAQIAGRAGRAMRDGTFGVTGRCASFDPEIVQRLESHSFEAVKVLQWRNTQLDFASLAALQSSLARNPAEPGLTRAPMAEDVLVLETAARDSEVRDVARTAEDVARLWECCQVPDYRKIAPAAHAELCTTLYGFLQRTGHVPAEWFARQLALADRTDGDIDTLSTRIAHVRTWTFVANRPDWLAEPEHWQAITRGLEDKLSDALHERLTQRFVDRRTSVLMRRLRENTMLETEISKTGDVLVEGHRIGHLQGFHFAPEASSAGPDAKALRAASAKALAGEIDLRAARFAEARDDTIVLAADGTVRWLGEAIARIQPGDEVLKPRLRLIADEQLTGAARDSVQARVDLWLKAHLEKLLGPLFALLAAEDVTGIARGVAFQIAEALGVLERQRVAEEVKGLDQAARAALRKYGVRFGAHHLYLPALLKPAPRALALHLWALKHGGLDQKGLDTLPHLAASGRTSIPVDHEVQKVLYRAVGYRVVGERAVRVDILERLADLIRPALAWRPAAPGPKPPGAVDGSGFTVTVGMTSLVGCSGEDFASILKALGYRMERRLPPVETAVAESPPATRVEGGEAAAAEAVAPGENEPAATADTAADAEPADAGPGEVAVESPASGEPASAQTPAEPETAEIETAEPETTELEATELEATKPEATELEATELEALAASPAEAAEAPSAEVAGQLAEPMMIEVWRIGGRHHDGRRPRRQGEGQGRPGRREPAAVAPEGAPEAQAETPAGGRRFDRPRSDHRR
ncbi:MAG: helicase, partial [Methylacidiphilales bacterium]|nr:helicase [Candidatus Methylacidiphilales bacterium]